MPFKYKILVVATPLIFVTDQLTKWVITETLAIGSRVPVIANFFDIVHFRNRGTAFGLFSNMHDGLRPFLFYGIAVVAVVVLVWYLRALPKTDRLSAIAIALVFGGIAGNITDRLRFGEVVDFLSFHLGDVTLFSVLLEWPAFNVADSAITIAMGLLVWSSFKKT